MKKPVPLVILIAVVAALTGGVVYLQRSGHARVPAPSVESAAGASVASAPPASPALRPRPGRRLSFDDAVRELDLVRPTRRRLAGDFTLRLASGRTFRLSAHRGQVVFINFWATWCPPCRQEMPAMERLYRHQAGGKFVLLAVSVDADASVVPPYLHEHGLTFPVAVDPRMELANVYGVRALPSSFIIDGQGNLVALALGPRPWDDAASHSLIERIAQR